MKLFIPLLLFFFSGLALSAQSVTNVKFKQDGSKIEVTYDLQNDMPMEIAVFCSTDGGRSFGEALKSVAGDVGKGVSPGSGKKIIWDTLKERDMLYSGQVAFKVTGAVDLAGEMILVEGGSFMMGCTNEQTDCSDSEKPAHRVTLSSYSIGKTETTVAQFKLFIDATNYQTDADKEGFSYVWTGSKYEKRNGTNWKCDVSGTPRQPFEYNHPVIHVSWNDATAYCNWLSRKTGKTYRLPTEAQWEYAARGGNKSRGTQYSGSNNLDEVAWHDTNSGSSTRPVGQKKPNELGICDMTGNVWEWCNDWYDESYYQASPSSNPQGAGSGSLRVYRGGSWCYDAQRCRVAYRNCYTPVSRYDYLGFRPVLVP